MTNTTDHVRRMTALACEIVRMEALEDYGGRHKQSVRQFADRFGRRGGLLYPMPRGEMTQDVHVAIAAWASSAA